jgi:mRNA interferase MazF
MRYEQKDIILVNLYPKKGHEVGKIRPCIILSNTLDNHELDTLIVVPISTELIDDVYPYRVRLPKKENLHKVSDVLINQLRTISKKRVTKSIGKVSDHDYEEIKNALCQII